MPGSDDARMRRLLAAQGAAPPVSDGLEGSPAYRDRSDSDYRSVESVQARARAKDMADAMTGGEHPAAAAARGLIQGFMGGLTGASTGSPPASGAPASPPATGATPEPTPAVSDELDGTPAAADEGRMRRLLAAQGQAPAASAPTPAPQTQAEPPEIEITPDDIADYERTHDGQQPTAQPQPQAQGPAVTEQAPPTGPQVPLQEVPSPGVPVDQAPPPVPPQTNGAPAAPSPADRIEGRTRELVAQATAVPQAVDPSTGAPTPPTEDEIAYRQSQLLDLGFADSVGSLARQQALEEERRRQELPLRQGYDPVSERVSQARIDALREFTRLHRQYWDQARQAQVRADARYPNPDQLLGGKGSWSRAVALGIAAAGGGVGMAGAAAVVNNAMNLEWAGRTAAYNRERQRMADAAMNGAEATNAMNVEDAALVGQQAAAKQRLADQFDLIAAQTGDQELRAKYQGLAAKLKEEAAKTLGTFATQTANRDLKNAQLGLTAAQIEEKRREFDLRHGGGVGGGNAGASNPYGKNGFYDPMHNVYLQAPDPERAREKEGQLEGISKSVRLIDHVLSLQQSQPGLWQKLMNKAGLTDEESATIQTYEADMIFALNEAHKMKRLTNKEEEIYEKVAADPHSIEKFMPQIVARLNTERTILNEDAGEVFRQYGRTSNIPGAPGPAVQRSPSEYVERLSGVPVIDKTGAWMPDRTNGNADHARPAMSRDEVLGGVRALEESTEGMDWSAAKPSLAQARANMSAAQQKVRGQWLLMNQERAKVIRSGGVSGREREAALDRVRGAMEALEAGVTRLSSTIQRRDAEARRKRQLEDTRTERMLMRMPH